MQILHLVLFLLKIESRKTFKSNFFSYLRKIDNIDYLTVSFWDNYYNRLQKWYLATNHETDVIVSASPEFILVPLAKRLGVPLVIATQMDPKTGKIVGENCRGEQKLIRLKESIKEPDIVRAYSDSMSDMPLLELAAKAFIVRKNRIIPLKEYKGRSPLRRLALRKSIEEATFE